MGNALTCAARLGLKPRLISKVSFFLYFFYCAALTNSQSVFFKILLKHFSLIILMIVFKFVFDLGFFK